MGIVFSIAAGGAMGAVLRHGVGVAFLRAFGPDYPWATVFVNIAGSFLMGALVGFLAHVWQSSQEMKAFLTVGLLGGFTTFSSFSLDAVMLWERGNILGAAGYVATSVLLSIAGLVAGLYLIRSVSA